MKTRFVKEQGVIKWLGQPIEPLDYSLLSTVNIRLK